MHGGKKGMGRAEELTCAQSNEAGSVYQNLRTTGGSGRNAWWKERNGQSGRTEPVHNQMKQEAFTRI